MVKIPSVADLYVITCNLTLETKQMNLIFLSRRYESCLLHFFIILVADINQMKRNLPPLRPPYPIR